MIVLSDFLNAATTDLLQGTRLQTVPRSGFLIFELSTTVATATNNVKVSIQMPNGDTPLTDVLVPANSGAGVGLGILDRRDMLRIALPVSQGGHAVLSTTLTGTCQLTYRITYTNNRP